MLKGAVPVLPQSQLGMVESGFSSVHAHLLGELCHSAALQICPCCRKIFCNGICSSRTFCASSALQPKYSLQCTYGLLFVPASTLPHVAASLMLLKGASFLHFELFTFWCLVSPLLHLLSTSEIKGEVSAHDITPWGQLPNAYHRNHVVCMAFIKHFFLLLLRGFLDNSPRRCCCGLHSFLMILLLARHTCFKLAMHFTQGSVLGH